MGCMLCVVTGVNGNAGFVEGAVQASSELSYYCCKEELMVGTGR